MVRMGRCVTTTLRSWATSTVGTIAIGTVVGWIVVHLLNALHWYEEVTMKILIHFVAHQLIHSDGQASSQVEGSLAAGAFRFLGRDSNGDFVSQLSCLRQV